MAVMFQKITLVASVLLWGYGISQAADTYAAVCDKVSDFRTFLKEEEEVADSRVRGANAFLIGALALIYASLLHFAGFALWVSSVALFKFALSASLADVFQRELFSGREISRPVYRMMKADGILNAVFAMFIIYLVLV